jgi:uncharacterized protein (AIM24 family)
MIPVTACSSTVAEPATKAANGGEMERLECQWCHAQSAGDARFCDQCGAPLDHAAPVSDSGWREAPRLGDLARFQFSNSACQVDGDLVPVAEVNLSPGDSVIFEHRTMLWKDESVPVSVYPQAGGLKRSIAGMPYVVTQAGGPGRIAFSRDAAGEIVTLVLSPSMELDAREHSFLAASHSISYTFERIKGLTNILHGGSGMYVDRFVTAGEPGVVLLHGYGNVFERTLSAGEKILVEPGGYLYKDSSVVMQAVQLNVRTGILRQGIYMAEMTGPGRVGIQSMYRHHSSE